MITFVRLSEAASKPIMKTKNPIVYLSAKIFSTRSVFIAAMILSVPAQGQNVYNTGYSTSSTPNGVVDNQWQVTAVSNLPGGYPLPSTPPYAAFVSGANSAYDM